MLRVDPACGFTFNVRSRLPEYAIAEDHEAVRIVQAALGANAVGRASFMTEAGLFGAAGIPTIVCGPGDIGQAHKPDEFVTAAQMARCEGFLLRLTESLAA